MSQSWEDEYELEQAMRRADNRMKRRGGEGRSREHFVKVRKERNLEFRERRKDEQKHWK